MPTISIERSDLDRADDVRVDIVLPDGTAFFGMVPRKAAAALAGTTVDYGGERVSLEIVTIADKARIHFCGYIVAKNKADWLFDCNNRWRAGSRRITELCPRSA